MNLKMTIKIRLVRSLPILYFYHCYFIISNFLDQCNTLNPLIIPEYLFHAIIVILVLLGGDWFTTVLNLPLLTYHIKKYAITSDLLLFLASIISSIHFKIGLFLDQ